MQKTNAMRILDKSKIEYNALTYDASDGHIDGAAVAKKTGQDPETVYKTLVTMGNSRNLYVFVIPVLEELDLKKCAKVSGEKKLEMSHVKDINKFFLSSSSNTSVFLRIVISLSLEEIEDEKNFIWEKKKGIVWIALMI